jgi:hypothetical protein
VFTLCVLLYGNYPALALRCLKSIARWADWQHVADVRVGLNAVSVETAEVVTGFLPAVPRPCHVYHEVAGRNVLKYPLMRRMLRDPDRPVAPLVTWFDDDSYLRGKSGWFGEVAAAFGDPKVHLLSQVYYLKAPFSANQAAAIEAQPWYGGKSVRPPHRPQFCAGGWWAARAATLRKWDYPFPDLQHNGGDVILGELCRQQGYVFLNLHDGVAINADHRGVNSAATRRGSRTPNLWSDWSPGAPADLTHHDFQVAVRSYAGVRETA